MGSLLAVARLGPETDRYRAVSNFVDTFFTQFRTLLEPGHHPKWREINLSPPTCRDGHVFRRRKPGWTATHTVVAHVPPQDMKAMFARFLDFRQHALGGTDITDAEKQELFNEFQRWQTGAGPLAAPRMRRFCFSLASAVLPAWARRWSGFSRSAPTPPNLRRNGAGRWCSRWTPEPSNYDCHANVSFAFLHPIAPHYSTLLRFDTAHYPRITGDLAESWTVSPDKLTYSFKLRPGVLFHDGSPLTAEDVKASYLRIVHPPAGVVSARQVDYASIGAIDTPTPLSVVFHLQWPDAAMLASFASPWNCIYEARKLAEDPRYPETHIMGTGPFVFVEHNKGKFWKGARWEHYFQHGKPYLDGYEADFMTGAPVVQGMLDGRLMGSFRSFTPAERDTLQAALGDRITTYESPWLIDLMLVFNAKQPPFPMMSPSGSDARCRWRSIAGAWRTRYRTRRS